MEIKYFKEKEKSDWDNFVQQNAADGGLLQSWLWGEFQKSLGRKVWRLAFIEQGEIKGAALVIRHFLPFGFFYFYCPRGPILKKELGVMNYELWLNTLKRMTEKEKATFLRLEPTSNEVTTLLSKEGFFRTTDVQPSQTLILDLRKSEEELLAQMKSKTRYNIKVAKKHRIQISRVGYSFSNLEILWQLLTLTAQRLKLKTHPKIYYQRILEVLAPPGRCNLYFARYQEKIIAANLVANFGNWLYYLHGASDYQYKNLMAPYLLHWQTILDGKKQGKKFYDFWGVSLTKKSWQGITRFKQGFAPAQKFSKYLGTWDWPVQRILYKIYQLTKEIKSH